MDPTYLQAMIQALMAGGGTSVAQPGPMPMQTGYGAMYGMPAKPGGGMLGTNPYQAGMAGGGYGQPNPNQLQQSYQNYPVTGSDGGGGGAEAR